MFHVTIFLVATFVSLAATEMGFIVSMSVLLNDFPFELSKPNLHWAMYHGMWCFAPISILSQIIVCRTRRKYRVAAVALCVLLLALLVSFAYWFWWCTRMG